MYSIVVKSTQKLSQFIKPAAYRPSRGLASKLIFSEYGEPVKVVQKTSEDENVLQPDKNEILVKMLAAPVNPVDINVIEGTYPARPRLPAVPGYEGVGIVEKVGPEVVEIQEGDHVIPIHGFLGTWRTHLVMASDKVRKVPQELGLAEAATLTINPCTAYRMLKDFSNLNAGDYIIQNGANSSCGQIIIQLCKLWGINSINIVRNRPDLPEVKNYLTELGATYVFSEEELLQNAIQKNDIQKPILGLNCVGGRMALEIAKYLEDGSVLITYGGMSKEPVYIPTSALIFKDIEVRGFWMTRWFNENDDSVEKEDMFEELITMIGNKDLQGSLYEMVKFDDYTKALEHTMSSKGMEGKKFILDFTS
ncbi:unnamed protein product [Phyllotreta striolata]|uniref:Enoyl-[acyl-carrier-protein] reductase, mitochondrial n=1 Tax=Phyllotreta striolata TaxID=444603 RepID=A0A9N9TJE8_PHYSR|nr:unnamed protein product [Phyllotreta striolata]